MSTYFGYVEREADSYINWAEIGRGLVTTIEDIHRVREEKKDAIDEASRAYANELQKAPQGEHRDGNKWTLSFADDASQYMLMQDRLLKSGQMNMKQYMISRQNLIDGTDRAFTMMKKYQESYKTMMDRYRKGEASQADVDNFGFLEKFGDFNKSSLYINPNDGSVSVGLVQEEKMIDGKKVRTMSKNPNDFANLSVLDGILNTKIDRFDSNKVATDLVGSIKPDVLTIYQGGLKITEKGVYNLKGQLVIADPFKSVTSTAQALDNLSKEVLNTITITDEATKKDVGAFGNESKVAQEFQRVKAIKDKGGQLNEKENKLYESVKAALAEVSQASDEEKAMAINFEESENAIIRASMPTPYQEQSVLVDNMKFYGNPKDNIQYSYTWDADEAKRDPSKILKVVEGNTVTYKLSPEQKAAAENYMRTQMRVRYAKEYTTEPTSSYQREEGLLDPTKTKKTDWTKEQLDAIRGDEYDRLVASHIMNLYSGDERSISNAIQFFKNSLKAKEVKRDISGVTVVYPTSSGGTIEKFIPFFTEENYLARTSRGFLDSAFNALNELLPEKLRMQNLTVARNSIKDELMPNLDYFEGVTKKTRGGLYSGTRTIPGFNTEDDVSFKMLKEFFKQKNRQSGGSPQGSSQAKGGSSLNASTRIKK